MGLVQAALDGVADFRFAIGGDGNKNGVFPVAFEAFLKRGILIDDLEQFPTVA